ncbi:hypothetical protein [uncultured Piscinibacter sp.]|uniref:hypothetical protein n=1 Tax=uncultured Piscinibacter sp. TaxID=1131835 RepID=UPI0026259A09|nr:hypothetical protein [uncultured Piscinibacter sp.]
MSKPSERTWPRRLAALTGVSLLAVAGLLQWPLGASAGVGPAGTIRPTGEPPASAVPAAPPATPKSSVTYRLRCWQYGRLIFDEGPVSLNADARLGAKLVGTDRSGAPLLVTDAGGTTCLARSFAASPSPAAPREQGPR